MFQGYYFAKPMPIHEFEEKYMGKADRQSIA
jgi:EAL domain-containing protein (putative c-di-GMP-specific phosphodiesterase class I)